MRLSALAYSVIYLFFVNVKTTLATRRWIQLSEQFGGPHGTEFSDQPSVSADQVIGSLTLHVGERCHGLELQISGPTPKSFAHGGSGGTYNTLTLGPGEYITSMEAYTAKHKGHTRIFHLRFGTSGGNSVSGGETTDFKHTATAPEGFQLGGFYGRDGDELDMLGVIWTRIPPTPETEPPGTVAPADSQPPADTTGGATISQPATRLSEPFGGPHGTEFSDQSAVVSGQTVASLTLHVGERCHGLELQISGPTPTTFTHGETGGAYNTLTLREGEYITSMEAHTAKQKGHTRVFY
ncbi:unnamed protein product [Phytophthora lilii]|uniref:Unnamed protein product n=1 Tax=Phytophthora lilii TaxID=2077276 RepID=A0A9W6TS43_9STRA|nr:unnamed protein product [Phytophthora lilii]